MKAHAGHRGNEMADQKAKEAARNKNIEECYIKIQKSVVINEKNNKVLIGGKENGRKQRKLQ